MEFVTIKEAALLLRVAPITVRRYIADGRLPAVRVGKGVRVSKEALEHLPKAVEPGSVSTGRRPVVSRHTGPNDSLWNIVGIAVEAGPSDVATQKLEYLAKAYAPASE